MKIILKYAIITAIFVVMAACQKKPIKYPDTKKVDVKDNYFGTDIADPYRWLEESNSPEVAAWVENENKITDSLLNLIPFREKLKERLTELWDYEKYSEPSKVGEKYFYSKNDGLQEQSVVYYQTGLDGEPAVFIDPNKFSDDGSISLAGLYFSNDHKYAGYGISVGGSDWNEFFVIDMATMEKQDDHLKWVKFSGMAWYQDGFFYSRYEEPKDEDKLKASNENQKLYYHRVGTAQSEDKLVLEDNQNPKRGFSAGVTDDEKFLIITGWEGSSSENLLFYKDLVKDSPISPVFDKFEATYYVIDNIQDDFLVYTNFESPNYKLIKIDPQNPAKENWLTIIPESENVLEGVSYVGGKLIASYLKDANSKVTAYDLDGNLLYDIELPGIGTAYGFEGKRDDNEVFYTFTSFTVPSSIYKYDIPNNISSLFRKSNVKFDMDAFETKQIFYKSKDGTEIPLFITHKKGLELNGDNLTLLYAYGGFNISMRPSFRLTAIPILESGGVYAMACLRGGGEYGEDWHKAGMLEKKQNVFDDYIAAAEYLIENKYTSSEKLAIQGGSNGGLLVGAVMNQRPELFKVAFPMVGVMDMLRFHKFTIGWAWASEYGSSDDSTQFQYLIKYSPLHNIKSGLNYPSTMITTADHDDRVFPAHSFKYAAELQDKYKGDNPVLIRIETKVGHGAGTSTSKTIELYSDMWAFMFDRTNTTPKL